MEPFVEERLLAECLDYFWSNKGFARTLEKIRDKYRSLGHVGGTIVLNNLSTEEKEALTGLLKKDFSNRKNATISIETIRRSLKKTRFGHLSLEELLQAYFDEELSSNKMVRTVYLEERRRFFMGLIAGYTGTPGGRWLDYAWFSKENAYKVLVQRYDANREELKEDIISVCRALNHLPGTGEAKIRLPVFAASIAKNPHAFDLDTSCGQLLLHALMFHGKAGKPGNAEERAELYYQAGILSDEVSNYVLCRGLRAHTPEGLHPGWEGFYLAGEPLMITLANLGRLKKVISHAGKVFVLETPGVFTAIMDKAESPNVPMVCTYGELKIAALALLDMLAQEGTIMYYSGDYDPEGLLIADRLKARYGHQLRLWRYTPQDYESAVSAEVLSSARIKKLGGLRDEALLLLAGRIEQKRLAGYQEMILDQLVSDISQLLCAIE